MKERDGDDNDRESRTKTGGGKKRDVCSRRENPMLCVHVYLMFIASQCYTGGSLRHLGRCVPLDLVMVTMKMVIFKSQNFLTCHCHFLPDFN